MITGAGLLASLCCIAAVYGGALGIACAFALLALVFAAVDLTSFED